MKTKKICWFVVGSTMGAVLLLIVNALAFAMKSGLSILIGGYTLINPQAVRAEWITSLHWWHFVIMGAIAYIIYAHMMKRQKEGRNNGRYLWWLDNVFVRFIITLVMLVGFEIVAHLLQFVFNALYSALTTLATQVTVRNTVSVEYFLTQIDPFRLICEALIAAQIVGAFARILRRNRCRHEAIQMAERERRERPVKSGFTPKKEPLYIEKFPELIEEEENEEEEETL